MHPLDMAHPTPPPAPPAASPTLLAARQRFIAAWGDMASAWGVSKTMAQVYALLYVSTEPLDTDHIMAELDISRGNASMTLHRLMEWGLASKVERPERDTRKDYYSAEKDVWALTLKVIRERNEKEIQPVMHHLTQIAQSLEPPAGSGRTPDADEAALKARIEEMAAFMQLFNTVVERMLPLIQAKDLKQIERLLKVLDVTR